jgi:DNA-binding NarL/FixJ family response regulator
MDARHWGQSRSGGTGQAVRLGLPPDGPGILSESWDELCRGRARITREYSDETGHHAELLVGERRSPSVHELEMLTRVVLGELQKVVALNEKRSPSSVATVAASALHKLGLACRPRETPLIVVMMAQAWHQRAGAWAPVECSLTPLGPRLSRLSVSRPDHWLDGVLSPCERKVLRSRVDGLSHDDVARVFDISRRTVANQIASGYKKLGVSGRLELLNRVLVPCDRVEAPARRPKRRDASVVLRLPESLPRPSPAP